MLLPQNSNHVVGGFIPGLGVPASIVDPDPDGCPEESDDPPPPPLISVQTGSLRLSFAGGFKSISCTTLPSTLLTQSGLIPSSTVW